ncbi:MAG: DUF1836 domain-containing protein [Firmicutes bacterium]|nr:DUF1836 domain-containing protein [Bacillota bacterium]
MRYEEYVNIQLEKMKKAGFIKSSKLPEIDLYIDQAEAFLRSQLDDLDGEAVRKFVTRSMINNYAKHDMIARPEGKKYTADHLIMIAMVLYFKGIFKMEDIENLMKPLVDNYNSEFDDTIDPMILYKTAEKVNHDFSENFSEKVDEDIDSIKKMLEDTDIVDDERMEVFILILSLAMRADAEKYLAARLLETYFTNPHKEKAEKIKRQKKGSEDKGNTKEKSQYLELE